VIKADAEIRVVVMVLDLDGSRRMLGPALRQVNESDSTSLLETRRVLERPAKGDLEFPQRTVKSTKRKSVKNR
jgi:hypothetical protein